MGNTSISAETSCELLNKYWQPLSKDIYRNKFTQELIQEKRVTFRTEDEMKYVFNCFLNRIHNFNSSVLKVVYLRKIVQPASVCDCSKSFTILLYLQHLQFTLKTCLQHHPHLENQNISIFSHTSHSKCICLLLLNGATYLKDRYGPFRVTQNNVWIQLPKKAHQLKSSHKEFQSQSKPQQFAQNLKIRVWISSEKEQNFPDQSCDEKQMVLSILNLIQQSFLPKKLCKCYTSHLALEKYRAIHKLKDLAEIVKKDHNTEQNSISLAKELQKQKVTKNDSTPFQRNIRSISLNQPGHHPSTYFELNHHYERFHQLPERKYTSIELVRKPVEFHKMTAEKKVERTSQVISQLNPFFSSTSKSISIKNQNQSMHRTFQHHKTHEIQFKNDHSLTKNQHKAIFKFQESIQSFQNEKGISLIHQQKTCLPFNQKVKYRQENTFYNQPIIGIADLSADLPYKLPSIVISSHQKTPKEQTTQDLHLESMVKQQATERQSERDQEKLTRINLQDQMGKRQIEKILEKGTNPTDRTKNEISSKGEDKKQGQIINSSRKHISVIPISLESTYGAGQSLKPILFFHDHPDQPTSTPVSGQQLEPSSNQNIPHQLYEGKKSSLSSIKSKQNYSLMHQVNFSQNINKKEQNIKKKDEKSKFLPKKKIIDPHDQFNQKMMKLKPEKSFIQREKIHSIINKIDTLATPNGDMGRLRQSEFIISAQNSFINSKSISVKQSDCSDLVEDKHNQISSLAQMEAKFPTVNDLGQFQEIEIQKSESHLFNDQENDEKVSKMPIHKADYKLIQSAKKSSLMSLAQHQKNRSNSSNNPSDPRTPVPTEQLQQIITDKVSSLIMREQEEPFFLQNVTEENYKVKIRVQESSQNQKQKMHHKKLSNPTFDKQYMKNKSLKDEFSHLLDFPKKNSFKALTESKDKLLILDQNEGRETYSIYNESEYNTSVHMSKRQSQFEMTGNPPLHHKESGNSAKWRKPFAKYQLEKQLYQKKEGSKKNNVEQQQNQQMRLTSSGHQDNSIKQKVRNKKAEFAELKNQMNSLLL